MGIFPENYCPGLGLSVELLCFISYFYNFKKKYCNFLQDEGWGDEEEDNDEDEVALSGQSLSTLIDQMSEDYINGK